MKTLIIMRHAKSSWKQAGQTDHDRPLNRRGKDAAPLMGRRIAGASLRPDLILCSTAERAKQTCEAVVEAADWSIEPIFTKQLYLATPSAIRSTLTEYCDSADTIMVIAHNPGLSEFTQELTGTFDHLPTGAVAHIKLPIDDWLKIGGPIQGELADFWTPKDADD